MMIDPMALMIEGLGWEKIPGVCSPEGRSLNRTTRVRPTFYALSYNGWDFELIPEGQVEELLVAARRREMAGTLEPDSLGPLRAALLLRLREMLGGPGPEDQP